MMKILNKKLITYSASALSFISLHQECKGEAIYFDIDPDISLLEDFDFANIDMDANGTIDFQFLNWSYYTTDSSLIFYQFRERIWAIAYSEPNAFAGTFDKTYYGTRFYPYALESGILINGAQPFQDAFIQRMAFRTFTVDGGTLVQMDQGGNWYPEVSDHYLGVKFIDAEECMHYGWIRCDVLDSGRTLIIKDYAYETKCDIGILTGDTIGDTVSVGIEEINSLEGSVYSFDATVYVKLDELKKSAEIRIYDLNGKIVYSGTLKNEYSQIELKEPTGVYLVQIINGENIFTKNIYLK